MKRLMSIKAFKDPLEYVLDWKFRIVGPHQCGRVESENLGERSIPAWGMPA